MDPPSELESKLTEKTNAAHGAKYNVESPAATDSSDQT